MRNELLFNLRIKEFQDFINLPKYNSAIENLIIKTKAHNISISLWQGSPYSKAQNSRGIYHLWIKTKPKSGNKKELLFDIMHEMGHCLDTDKLAPDRSNEQARESRAWAFADQEINNHPELGTLVQEYENYKNSCLLSYGIKS